MQRPLLVVAIVEAFVIAVLVVLLASRAGPAPPPVSADDHERVAAPAVVQSAPAAAAPVSQAPSPAARAAIPEPPEPADPNLGTLLYGRLVDARGEPIDGGSVYVRRADERTGMSAAVTPGRGYAVVGLAPATWTLSARAEGFKPFQVEVAIEDRARQRLDVTLQRAHVVNVAFVDETGAPAQKRWQQEGLGYRVSVTAVALLEEPPAQFGMTTLRSVHGIGVGQWRPRMHDSKLPERFDGVLEIDAPGAVWVAAVLRQIVVGRRLVQPGETEIDLAIDTAALRAKLATARLQVVASESGTPLEGARVDFSDRQTGGGGQPTDAAGRLTVANLVPGILELTIHAKDREVYYRMLRIDAGADLDLGQLGVDLARQAGGIVRDAAGTPVGGVSFRWFRLDRAGADVPLDSGMGARSDSEGKFALFGVGAGRYLLRGNHDAGIVETIVDTTAGDAIELDVRLQEGVAVTIENRLGAADSFLVRVTHPSGEPAAAWLEWPMPTMRERPFRLLAGRYVVQIFRDTELVRRFDLDTRRSGARIVVP